MCLCRSVTDVPWRLPTRAALRSVGHGHGQGAGLAGLETSGSGPAIPPPCLPMPVPATVRTARDSRHGSSSPSAPIARIRASSALAPRWPAASATHPFSTPPVGDVALQGTSQDVAPLVRRHPCAFADPSPITLAPPGASTDRASGEWPPLRAPGCVRRARARAQARRGAGDVRRRSRHPPAIVTRWPPHARTSSGSTPCSCRRPPPCLPAPVPVPATVRTERHAGPLQSRHRRALAAPARGSREREWSPRQAPGCVRRATGTGRDVRDLRRPSGRVPCPSSRAGRRTRRRTPRRG